MQKIRLNKYLASCGVASRRKVDVLIEQGKVSVDGKIAELGMAIDPEKSEITVNGKQISSPNEEKIYIILNKPVGLVSTVTDDLNRPTVVDYVKRKLKIDSRIYPVGRLDSDSEGLMLLTNDGYLTHELTHPSYKVKKTYLVTIKGKITEEKINSLRQGISLKDGMTAQAEVEIYEEIHSQETSAVLKVSIYEGRKRQIRRMCNEVRFFVVSLKRISIGDLQLGDLNTGEARFLSKREIKTLMT